MDLGSVWANRSAPQRQVPLVAGLTALGIGVWTFAILVVPAAPFIVHTPRGKTSFDVSIGLLSIFVALVLLMFPDERLRARLDWLAVGILTLGLGNLVFGVLVPALHPSADWQQAMYSSLVVRIAALSLIGVGLVPRVPPRLTPRLGAGVAGVVALAAAAVAVDSGRLPILTRIDDIQVAAAQTTGIMAGLTGWHWVLSSIPLGLALLAAGGLVRHMTDLRDHGWLLIAVTLLAGTQLHILLWPSAYSPVMTTASLLRLGFTITMAIGAMLALRGVAMERSALLVIERASAIHNAEDSLQRAEFTAMIGHELASPVATLRAHAALLRGGHLDPGAQAAVGTALAAEVDLLGVLVEDLRAVARAERVAFDQHIEPVQLAGLLADAATFARSLGGDHPVAELIPPDGCVLADPERIAQVLRNLLGNAARHTPPGTPIAVRSRRKGERVTIEVVDGGPGISIVDADRIFEKFGRGPEDAGERAVGLGLGLYVSRRIVQAHGGELGVYPTPGGGATFWFTLPATP